MCVVAIVGPSHAGKATLLKKLVADSARLGFASSPQLLDLDAQLGSNHRSDVPKAVELVGSHTNKGRVFLLVDVGAGQVVQKDFRDFLHGEAGLLTVAVWCDERTFRSRHSPDTRDNEFRNNYSRELCALWRICRELGQLVDTSDPATIEQSLEDLVCILQVANLS